jgi:hypothetical protein
VDAALRGDLHPSPSSETTWSLQLNAMFLLRTMAAVQCRYSSLSNVGLLKTHMVLDASLRMAEYIQRAANWENSYFLLVQAAVQILLHENSDASRLPRRVRLAFVSFRVGATGS